MKTNIAIIENVNGIVDKVTLFSGISRFRVIQKAERQVSDTAGAFANGL